MRVRTQQNDTVDALCWRHYKRTAGVVETVLNANPGIADHGVILPMGLLVEMPDMPPTSAHAPLIQLFD
ncbi:phage tail protein X [Robbsia andropogonis]|uniref:tail protein X n=1 Tax=Robbsia andropogonis TaxID=28092 RepID=UPI003D23E5AA